MIEKYFKVLELEVSANKEEIKKAYRKLAHQYHPDKGGDEKKMKELNEAYDVLIGKTKIPVQPFVQRQQGFWYRVNYDQYVNVHFSGTDETAGTNFTRRF